MKDYRLLLCIVKRDQYESYLNMLKSIGIEAQFSSLCHGTASKSVLDYLGIEKTEKVLLQAFVPSSYIKKILRRLVDVMGIEVPGNGIAMSIPVGSVGGQSSFNYLTKGQQEPNETTSDEVKKMNDIMYSLIVAITAKGNTDTVMDAARSAGARGGTVINARGTAPGAKAKFFGLSISNEKEIVYILTLKSDKDKIMHAIMEKAGMHTDAQTVLFSLPVDSMVGLRSLAPENEDE